jgi:hypothetical protein
MIKRYGLIIGLALLTAFAQAFLGCFQANLTDPGPGESCTAMTSGSPAAAQVLSMAQSAAAAAAMVKAKAPDAQASPTSGCGTASYIDPFSIGQEYVTIVHTVPSPAPTASTTINNAQGGVVNMGK